MSDAFHPSIPAEARPVLARLRAHRSIRRFRPDPVPAEYLAEILEAARRASSSGNMQSYSIIVTRDALRRRELHALHFEQDLVLEAPVFLTFCADFRRMRRWLALSEAADNFDNEFSFGVGAIDAILASQHAATAAEALGLGICYLGTTLAQTGLIAKALRCPPGVVPVVGFALGRPAEHPALRDRLPLESLVHEEDYRDPSDEDVRRAYAERERAGWKRYAENPELAERMRESGVKNLAQVYTTLKYTRESHLGYSRHLLETLRAQDFTPKPKS